MQRLVSLALAAALAGCGAVKPSPEAVAEPKPPPGITLRLEQGKDMAQLDQRAESYCSQYGRHAKRAKTEPVRDSGDELVQYDCT
jgi:hypothetical protein